MTRHIHQYPCGIAAFTSDKNDYVNSYQWQEGAGNYVW